MSTAPGPEVVVAVDGSASSAAALRWAAAHVAAVGGTLHAVTAWNLPDGFGWGSISGLDWPGNARRHQEAALTDALGPAAAGVRRQVVEGRTARALLDAAEGADLLVVGSRGHGAFSGMLLGSVSRHLVAHAHCPVVVVRAPEDRVQAADAGDVAAVDGVDT